MVLMYIQTFILAVAYIVNINLVLQNQMTNKLFLTELIMV